MIQFILGFFDESSKEKHLFFWHIDNIDQFNVFLLNKSTNFF